MEVTIILLFLLFNFLSFPPFSLFFLQPLALFLFIYLGLRTKAGNLKIFTVSWIAQFSILYWISYAIGHYGNVSPLLALIPTLLLTAYLAIYPLVFIIITRKIEKKSFFPAYTASLWVFLDFIKSNFLSGFPWEIIGYSVFPFQPFMNVTDIGGIFLVEFLMIFTVSIFFTEKRGTLWKTAALLSVALVLLYGEVDSLVWKRVIIKNDRELTIGVAQGSIDQSVKWDKSYRKTTLEIYSNLTEKLSKEGARVIFWPETAIPFYFQSNPLSSKIRQIAINNQTYLVAGSPAYRYEQGKEKELNRVYLISPLGKVEDFYDKVHLVPFGEYLPMEKYLEPIAEKFFPMVGVMSPGKEIKPLSNNFKVGVLICYESIFPEITRGMIKKGATLMANITNDAWFGKTSAPYQHFSLAAFRAVESKKYLVRSANTGISGIVSPWGEVLKSTRIFKTTGFVKKVKLINKKTLYTISGNWIVWVSLFLLLTSPFI